MTKLDIAIKVAWSFIGKPYTWGGDTPMNGFDCSGLLVEILKSVGLIERKTDYSAAGLYARFKDFEINTPEEGAMLFWESNGKIIHVEFCIDSSHTIGASGGGHKTITIQDAIEQNAFIKVRPIRKGYRYVVNPFKKYI
jgi:cell wall-associated NlpC family hydrolase